MNISISSERLTFRLLHKNDIKYMFLLSSDPDVMQFFPSGVLNLKETQDRLDSFLRGYDEHNLPVFLLFDQKTGGFVGRAGFSLINNIEVEVGYVLQKKYWKQGFATEALEALLLWSKDNVDFNKIIAMAPTDHVASHGVMKKCGMIYCKEDLAYGVPCTFYQKINQ
ncbi:GNAT family N-acetyltransferase [Shewanella surugensis]|uniref:GNAT family N-acetyltransferase n=1 Tax=Shewanella surugensis TaxID=212020 RepID=A0ABT0LIQ0_9GAMM|nr:GNAT family N-acetyltransferase [Shewanella surugensis]MCL1127550.1 GNAT family N-acetyltransferase [Shewanella surugensis]